MSFLDVMNRIETKSNQNTSRNIRANSSLRINYLLFAYVRAIKQFTSLVNVTITKIIISLLFCFTLIILTSRGFFRVPIWLFLVYSYLILRIPFWHNYSLFARYTHSKLITWAIFVFPPASRQLLKCIC